MRKLIATICVLASGFAVSACDSARTSNPEVAVPYKDDRTAGAQTGQVTRAAPVRAERTFSRAQAK